MAPDDPTMNPGTGPADHAATTESLDSNPTPPEGPAAHGPEPGSAPDDLALVRRPDLTSLVAGLALMMLGVLLVLRSEDVLELSLGYFWPALLAAVGAVLLASGLRRRRER